MDTHLSQAEFEQFSELIYKLTGISLNQAKQALLATRLVKRLRACGFDSFTRYREHISSEQGKDELRHMIDAISTNKTSFYREAEHFRFFAERVLPKLAQGPIRIWSAACSSGEEPYTIAMVIRKHLPHWQHRDIKILATDISSRMLDRAEAGIYQNCEESMSVEELHACFQRGQGEAEGKYKIRPELRSLVHFRHLNLMEPFPFHGKFHCIFCRNVMIYFDAPTRAALVKRLALSLHPGGYLFVGHSESLGNTNIGPLHYVMPAAYRYGGDS